MNITRFGTGDNLRLWGHDATQRTKLLLQQRKLFGYFNQHAHRGSRQFAQAIQESHGVFVHPVQTQVMAGSLFRDKRVIHADRTICRQGTGQRAEAIVKDERRAFGLIYLI